MDKLTKEQFIKKHAYQIGIEKDVAALINWVKEECKGWSLSQAGLNAILFDHYSHSLPRSQKGMIVEIISSHMGVLSLTMGNLRLTHLRALQHHEEFAEEAKKEKKS